MAGVENTSDRAWWIADANAFLVSALCHLVGMIALGLMAATVDRGPEIGLKGAVADEPIEAAILEAWFDDGITLQAAGNHAGEALGPVRLFDVSAMAASDFSALKAPTQVATDAGGLAGTAFGDYGKEDGPLPGTSNFFGVGGYGRSFVYVVDCSGSMNEEGKFWRAVSELMRSIESLESDQTYYVIFYNHMAYPMDAKAPITATEEHIEQTREWVAYVQPQGGTRPLPALLVGLSLKPDAIFFLSDGRFDPGTSVQVRAKNRPKKGQRIPIHAIAFASRETEAMMRTIARGSGGEYRFVE